MWFFSKTWCPLILVRIICCSESSEMIRWELIVPLLISHEVFVDIMIPWKWCPLTLIVGRKCSIYRFERYSNNRVFHLRSEDTTMWFYRCKFIKEVSFALLSTVRALKSFGASFRPDSRTEKCQKNWRYVLVQGSIFERNHFGGRVSSSEYQSESIYGYVFDTPSRQLWCWYSRRSIDLSLTILVLAKTSRFPSLMVLDSQWNAISCFFYW